MFYSKLYGKNDFIEIFKNVSRYKYIWKQFC